MTPTVGPITVIVVLDDLLTRAGLSSLVASDDVLVLAALASDELEVGDEVDVVTAAAG